MEKAELSTGSACSSLARRRDASAPVTRFAFRDFPLARRIDNIHSSILAHRRPTVYYVSRVVPRYNWIIFHKKALHRCARDREPGRGRPRHVHVTQ